MPVKLLIIEDQQEIIHCYNTILERFNHIQFELISSFELLELTLSSKNYTHIISAFSIEGEKITDYPSLNKITLLVFTNEFANIDAYKILSYPVTYEKVFSFLSDTSGFTFNTLKNYALDEPDILNELKHHLREEFELNLEELPKMIAEKDLKSIKSKAHQMSSKFSLLEMNSTYKLSKEIESKIFQEPEKQLEIMSELMFDLEIVLNKLKN